MKRERSTYKIKLVISSKFSNVLKHLIFICKMLVRKFTSGLNLKSFQNIFAILIFHLTICENNDVFHTSMWLSGPVVTLSLLTNSFWLIMHVFIWRLCRYTWLTQNYYQQYQLNGWLVYETIFWKIYSTPRNYPVKSSICSGLHFPIQTFYGLEFGQ